MRRLGLTVAALAVLGGCSAGADLKQADAGVAAFHQAMNGGRFEAIYAGAAPEMKASTTQAALVQLLGAVHRKLGDHVSGAQSTWNVNYGTAGRIVTVIYASKYARGAATERFVYRLGGATPSLVGYNINSTALIVN